MLIRHFYVLITALVTYITHHNTLLTSHTICLSRTHAAAQVNDVGLWKFNCSREMQNNTGFRLTGGQQRGARGLNLDFKHDYYFNYS